jgi:hypothetical protein
MHSPVDHNRMSKLGGGGYLAQPPCSTTEGDDRQRAPGADIQARLRVVGPVDWRNAPSGGPVATRPGQVATSHERCSESLVEESVPRLTSSSRLTARSSKSRYLWIWERASMPEWPWRLCLAGFQVAAIVTISAGGARADTHGRPRSARTAFHTAAQPGSPCGVKGSSRLHRFRRNRHRSGKFVLR